MTAPYERITPEEIEASLADLDYAIFERLPEEGKMLGYHPMFVSTRYLADELNDALPEGTPREAFLTVGQLGSRMTLLVRAKFVVPVYLGLHRRKIDGWQRTEKAKEFLDRRARLARLRTEREGS